MHSSACQLESTYSQTGSRGLRVEQARIASAGSEAAQAAQEPSVDSAEMCSRVQRAAAAASREKSEIGISSITTRSWLPARQRSQCSRASATQLVGLGAVAHEIAQAPDLLGALDADVGEHGLEGGQVSVHVRKERDAHLGAFYDVAGWGVCGCRWRSWWRCAPPRAATFLLRPRSGLIEPAPVDVQAYFTAFQLDRAEDYRSVQRVLGAAGIVVSTGTLALLAWRPPKALLDRLGRRPLLGAAAAGAGISLLLVAVDLPLAAWRRARALDVGLATQSWPDWAADVGSPPAIGAAFAAAGGVAGARAGAALPAQLVGAGGRARSWRSGWSRSGSIRC